MNMRVRCYNHIVSSAHLIVSGAHLTVSSMNLIDTDTMCIWCASGVLGPHHTVSSVHLIVSGAHPIVPIVSDTHLTVSSTQPTDTVRSAIATMCIWCVPESTGCSSHSIE